jgi:hypothetical protein
MDLKIADLEKIYLDAENADKETFSEERSNILLIAGEHYTRKNQAFNQTVRDNKSLSDSQKLRITKNHVHKVYRTYVDRILGFSPGVAIVPQKNSELQDQKDAELNAAVWQDAKYRHRIKEKTAQLCEDFIALGACAVKVFWDPTAGQFKGYEPKMMLDDLGQPLLDEMGQPVPQLDEMGQPVLDKTKPIFSGDMVHERIFDFNLLYSAGAMDIKEAPCVIVRKMVNTKELEAKYKDNEEKLKFVKDSVDKSFIVFDATKQSYEMAKDQTLIKEYYFKPCYKYPMGYFYYATSQGILEEGELPFGIFPIVYAGFDTHPTARRAKSIIKVVRPFQAEINRASSAVATHQVTLGDDKVVYQAGTKLNPGALLPGVRGVTYQGSPPTIIPGRTGAQYLDYITSTITEMYDVAMMAEENEDKGAGQYDANTQLYRSLRQQKKYARYGEKFNQFLVDWCELYLKLAKEYLPDDQLIYAVGRQEIVNIPEFRKTSPLCYRVRVEEQDETLETKLGKQLTFTNILQYVGKQLKPEDVGKIIKAMPFGNVEEAFEDLTIDYENARNDILALDRGEAPVPNEYENHVYIINKLTHRTKQADFKFLSPEIQQNYQNYIALHQQMEAEKQMKLLQAKQGLIPTSGALVACDMYQPNSDPNKAPKRVRIPYDALNDLVQKLQVQGMGLDELEKMNEGRLAETAQYMMNQFNQNLNTAQAPAPGLPQNAGWPTIA